MAVLVVRWQQSKVNLWIFYNTRKPPPHHLSGQWTAEEERGPREQWYSTTTCICSHSCNILCISVTYLLWFSRLKGRIVMALYVFSQFSFAKQIQLMSLLFFSKSQRRIFLCFKLSFGIRRDEIRSLQGNSCPSQQQSDVSSFSGTSSLSHRLELKAVLCDFNLRHR